MDPRIKYSGIKYNTPVIVSPGNEFIANDGLTMAGLSGRIVGYGGITGSIPIVEFKTPGVGFDENQLTSPVFFPEYEKEKTPRSNLGYIPIQDLLFPSELSVKATTQQTKKDTTMSKVIDMVKNDTKEAAYRVASTQITNGVKTALIKLVEAKVSNKDQMEQFKSLLDSSIGDSIVAMVLGYGLMAVPKLKNDSRVQKLSEEFRVKGMADVGNTVMSMMTDSLMPLLNSALSNIPDESSVRVMTENSEVEESVGHEEQVEEEQPKRVVKK